ncbi:hypothetical protein [Chryseobacterium bernardetii]|uniref:hypothetical protein n=1 Tax=Chryseobacterium bernardetii TaxID=1241978 RepID=UPI00268F7A15
MNSQHRETVVLNTKFGTITAFKENGIIRAKSIRYARSERFQKPVPVDHFIFDSRFKDKTSVCPALRSLPTLENFYKNAYLLAQSLQTLSSGWELLFRFILIFFRNGINCKQ